MEEPATVESALLDWASGVEGRLQGLVNRLDHVQDALFAFGIVLLFHCLGHCLCPAPRQRVTRYKH